MTQPAKPFDYNIVLSLDSSHLVRESLPTIQASLGNQRLLAATLNHRFFTLPEKNFIKGTIEAHDLDHLMFSIRPSSRALIGECTTLEIERFRDLSQLVFVLQVMARYDIAGALIASDHITARAETAVSVGQVENDVRSLLDDISARFGKRVNVRKQLPWLYSVTDLLPTIRDRQLLLLRSVPRTTQEAAFQYDDQQISPLEKDLFWVGFDPSYKEVPVEKPYQPTKWTELAVKATPGKGLYESGIQYCTRCCLPATMEGISFDEIGICVPCRSSEEKMHIDWEERAKRLSGVLESVRSETYYDCMLPTSGGKDSVYQAHILTKMFGVTPLAVTHGQNWLSVIGRYNLENSLQQFDLDHIVFNMNRGVINRMARKSLANIGDACWHCHIGTGTFPLQTALAWKIDLMCYGESIAEADGRGSYHGQSEASLFYNLEISAKVKAEDMSDEETPTGDLSAWVYPSKDRLKESRLRYIHLGDYFFWDEERQVEFVKRHYDWMEGTVENAYKGFKSVECVMAGVHDYANFIKRGIGRSTVQASTDVRRGLLTREEGFELAKTHDTQRPHALDFYLSLTGLTETEFESTLVEARAKSAFASKLSKT